MPAGLLTRFKADGRVGLDDHAKETGRVAQVPVRPVLETERRLDNDPRDVSAEKRGDDVECRVPWTGKLRFIEVKGRVSDARTMTVTTNEILTALNKRADFILAIVEVNGEAGPFRYVRRPFRRKPDCGVTSMTYALAELLARAEDPA